MPRPLPPGGKPRRPVPLRLSPLEEAPIQRIADAEYGGNLSEAMRCLLIEAVDARENGRRPILVAVAPASPTDRRVNLTGEEFDCEPCQDSGSCLDCVDSGHVQGDCFTCSGNGRCPHCN